MNSEEVQGFFFVISESKWRVTTQSFKVQTRGDINVTYATYTYDKRPSGPEWQARSQLLRAYVTSLVTDKCVFWQSNREMCALFSLWLYVFKKINKCYDGFRERLGKDWKMCLNLMNAGELCIDLDEYQAVNAKKKEVE